MSLNSPFFMVSKRSVHPESSELSQSGMSRTLRTLLGLSAFVAFIGMIAMVSVECLDLRGKCERRPVFIAMQSHWQCCLNKGLPGL